MKCSTSALRLVLRTIVLAFAATAASAQIPPHKPGIVCVANDRSLWCWVASAGPVGAPCFCQTPFGAVPGRLQ
jgi:hypothetical protein